MTLNSVAGIRSRITENKSNVEYVLAHQIKDLRQQFSALENEIIRARLLDVQDVYHRLLRNILDIEHVRVTPLKKMPQDVILVAEQLLPSDIALLDMKKIIGIIVETVPELPMGRNSL